MIGITPKSILLILFVCFSQLLLAHDDQKDDSTYYYSRVNLTAGINLRLESSESAFAIGAGYYGGAGTFQYGINANVQLGDNFTDFHAGVLGGARLTQKKIYTVLLAGVGMQFDYFKKYVPSYYYNPNGTIAGIGGSVLTRENRRYTGFMLQGEVMKKLPQNAIGGFASVMIHPEFQSFELGINYMFGEHLSK